MLSILHILTIEIVKSKVKKKASLYTRLSIVLTAFCF